MAQSACTSAKCSTQTGIRADWYNKQPWLCHALQDSDMHVKPGGAAEGGTNLIVNSQSAQNRIDMAVP